MACTNLEGARCLFDLFFQKSSDSFCNYTPQDLTNANRSYNDDDNDDDDHENDNDNDNDNDNGNTKICCFRTENCLYSFSKVLKS